MIRNRLAEILAMKNIKQTDLSAMTNISRNTISNIVNNSSDMIKYSTVDQICHCLNINPHDFFEFSPYQLKIATEIEYIPPTSEYAVDTSLVFVKKYESDFIIRLTGIYSYNEKYNSKDHIFGGIMEYDKEQGSLVDKPIFINTNFSMGLKTSIKEMIIKDIDQAFQELNRNHIEVNSKINLDF